MKKTHEIPAVNGVDLNGIRNRNEKRVATILPEILEEAYQDYIFDPLDIQDIYALSLNLLPAHYAQSGSIVLSNKLSEYEIKGKLRVAIERVLENPTRAGNEED